MSHPPRTQQPPIPLPILPPHSPLPVPSTGPDLWVGSPHQPLCSAPASQIQAPAPDAVLIPPSSTPLHPPPSPQPSHQPPPSSSTPHHTGWVSGVPASNHTPNPTVTQSASPYSPSAPLPPPPSLPGTVAGVNAPQISSQPITTPFFASATALATAPPPHLLRFPSFLHPSRQAALTVTDSGTHHTHLWTPSAPTAPPPPPTTTASTPALGLAPSSASLFHHPPLLPQGGAPAVLHQATLHHLALLHAFRQAIGEQDSAFSGLQVALQLAYHEIASLRTQCSVSQTKLERLRGAIIDYFHLGNPPSAIPPFPGL